MSRLHPCPDVPEGCRCRCHAIGLDNDVPHGGIMTTSAWPMMTTSAWPMMTTSYWPMTTTSPYYVPSVRRVQDAPRPSREQLVAPVFVKKGDSIAHDVELADDASIEDLERATPDELDRWIARRKEREVESQARRRIPPRVWSVIAVLAPVAALTLIYLLVRLLEML
jgi:hypothetical protein